MKRIIALVLSLVMALSLCAPAWAVEEPADGDDMPVAEVTVLDAKKEIVSKISKENTTIFETGRIIDTTGSGMGLDIGKVALDTAYQFQPTMSYEEATATDCAKWHADFVVKADKDIPAFALALAGYYDAWCSINDFKWVALASDETIPADTEIRLVYYMGGGAISVNYEELCQYGNDDIGFLCGAVELSNEMLSPSGLTTVGLTDGTTLTVELRLYETEEPSKENGNSTNEETGDYEVICTTYYTFGPVAMIDETVYDTLQKAVDAAENGDTIIVMANGLSATVSESKFFTVEYAEDVTKEATIDPADGYEVSVNDGTYSVKKLYNVAFDANGGSGTLTIAPMVESEFTLPECPFTAPAGKQFKGWATSKDATEVLGESYKVSGDVTFYAIWEDAIVTVPVPDKDNNETSVEVEAVVSGNTATISKVEKLEEITSSDAKAESVTLDFSEVKGAVENTDGEVVETPVSTVVLPATEINKIAAVVTSTENDVESLEIVLSKDTSIAFDAEAMKKLDDSGDITVSLVPVEENELEEEHKDVVGDRPAFEVKVTDKNGENIFDKENSKDNGTITLSVPYVLGENESTWGLVVYFVDDDGVKHACSTSYANGTVTWKTNHMSLYMIDHVTYTGGYYVPTTSTTPSTDKTVVSADTFDAGIGMYVAMSVMAAAGSAIVIGKKKEF